MQEEVDVHAAALVPEAHLGQREHKYVYGSYRPGLVDLVVHKIALVVDRLQAGRKTIVVVEVLLEDLFAEVDYMMAVVVARILLVVAD